MNEIDLVRYKPEVLVAMETKGITPEAVGLMIKDILEYLDKMEAED